MKLARAIIQCGHYRPSICDSENAARSRPRTSRGDGVVKPGGSRIAWAQPRIEHGLAVITVETMERIATGLGIPSMYLMANPSEDELRRTKPRPGLPQPLSKLLNR